MILSLHGVEGGWKGTEVTGRLYSWQPGGDRQPPCHSWGGRDCLSWGESRSHCTESLIGAAVPSILPMEVSDGHGTIPFTLPMPDRNSPNSDLFYFQQN